MKNLIIILACMFSYVANLNASTHQFSGKHLTTDQFGNYYEVSDTEIKKYELSGKLNCSYSNNVLGVIASIDVSNPYKVLVYFRDFTKVLILDNTLSPTTETIDLTEIDLDETTLVCRSYNEGMWYYNPVNFELIRKNRALITTNNSGNLANSLGKNIQPIFLVEYNNKIYLNDSLQGILVFDNYGTYLKTIPVKGITRFQVKDKYLLYVNKDGLIETYNFFTLDFVVFKAESYNEVEEVRIENQQVFVVNKNNELIIDKIQ